jgi:hypothetical protein
MDDGRGAEGSLYIWESTAIGFNDYQGDAIIAFPGGSHIIRDDRNAIQPGDGENPGGEGRVAPEDHAAAISWRSPWSQTVAQVGHDPVANELHVIWSNDGAHSVYEGVTADHANEIMNSGSVGAAVRELRHVPDRHPHRYHDG